MAKQNKEALLQRVEDLRQAIEETEVDVVNIAVSLRIKDLKDLHRVYAGLSPSDILTRRKSDLAWFTGYLEEDGERAWKYRGQYVGVLAGEVRAWASSRKLVELQLQEMLGGKLPSYAIIVPVRVPDEEANEQWMSLHHELGLDIHPE